MIDTQELIKIAVEKFCAVPGSKFVSTSAGSFRVRTGGERVLHLPDGRMVKITTDASGVATQVEEDERLHAIVRPKTIRKSLGGRA